MPLETLGLVQKETRTHDLSKSCTSPFQRNWSSLLKHDTNMLTSLKNFHMNILDFKKCPNAVSIDYLEYIYSNFLTHSTWRQCQKMWKWMK